MPDNKPARRADRGWPDPTVNAIGDPADPDRLQRRVVVIGAVVLAAAALAFVIPYRHAGPPDTVEAQWVYPAASGISSTPPSPTGTPSAPPSPTSAPVEVPTRTATASRPAQSRPAATTPRGSAAPTGVPGLAIGATIGLQVEGKPGLLVRHRDFIARLEQFSSTSNALDKNDAKFIVRKGLAFDGCVSFEAVSQPGFYLRRFFSDLLLHQQNESDIYRQEVTFCPVPNRNGQALTLLVLFPSGFAVTTAPDGKLRLDNVDRITPTGFVVRQPI